MRLNLVLDTDNAAFEGDQLGPEVSRIFEDLAKEFSYCTLLDRKLRDINGNTVGSIKWS
tara:strand:+ start:493 stop:669 length:177 start_codon:yes stop_codon:yes gene_type:complete